MLSGRNVVIATIVIAVISLLTATSSLTSNDEDQVLGTNSFGVRSHGHRGLFEILAELDIDVSRAVAPPGEYVAEETTLAFFEPDRTLIQTEPAHLQSVFEWVKAGGTVVYAPSDPTSTWLGRRSERGKSQSSDANESQPPKSFNELIGIPNVPLMRCDVNGTTPDGLVELSESSPSPSNRDPNFTEAMDSLLNPKEQPIAEVKVRRVGDWQDLPGSPVTVVVPQRSVQLMKADDDWPAVTNGGLVVRRVVESPEEESPEEENTDYWLAASFPVGAGNVIVVSDAALAENAWVARRDNAILIVAFLTMDSERVVFDEFYHGLTSRGNPFVLLQRPGFATLLSLICLTLAIYAWRHGQRLGPAILMRATQRRSLSEYVDAMARLFAKGRDRTSFLVRENRDGLNWMLQKELGLAPSKHPEDDIHSLLVRRDPKRAATYQSCLKQLAQMQSEPRVSDRDVLDAMKKVENCL